MINSLCNILIFHFIFISCYPVFINSYFVLRGTDVHVFQNHSLKTSCRCNISGGLRTIDNSIKIRVFSVKQQYRKLEHPTLIFPFQKNKKFRNPSFRIGLKKIIRRNRTISISKQRHEINSSGDISFNRGQFCQKFEDIALPSSGQ